MNFSDHLSIGWQLLCREAYVASHSLRTDVIDTVVMTLSALFTFGYFMPGMGMPQTLRLPAYLGGVVVMALFFGFIRGGLMSIDLDETRTTHYFTALPTSLWVSLSVPVLSAVMRTMMLTIPAGAIGVWWLGSSTRVLPCWWQLLIALILGHLFLALVFMIALFTLPTDRYYSDLWPRFLGPMFSFGCLFFTWRSIALLRPGLARLLLLNPLVHVIEGIRGALLPATNSVPFGITSSALLCVIVVLSWWYVRAASQRLALVVQRRK